MVAISHKTKGWECGSLDDKMLTQTTKDLTLDILMLLCKFLCNLALTQPAHDARTTLYGHCNQVTMLKRLPYNVLTSCNLALTYLYRWRKDQKSLSQRFSYLKLSSLYHRLSSLGEHPVNITIKTKHVMHIIINVHEGQCLQSLWENTHYADSRQTGHCYIKGLRGFP